MASEKVEVSSAQKHGEDVENLPGSRRTRAERYSNVMTVIFAGVSILGAGTFIENKTLYTAGLQFERED